MRSFLSQFFAHDMLNGYSPAVNILRWFQKYWPRVVSKNRYKILCVYKLNMACLKVFNDIAYVV